MAFNLTVDDFDPLVAYSNYGDWQTPNPQDNPTWWNATQDVTGSQWHQDTYHLTTVSGAQASFNFTGSALQIFGGTGANPNYTVSIDNNPSTLTTANNTAGRTLLYGNDSLPFVPHTVQITNHGGGLLLDLFVVGTKLGGDGATFTNTTVDDRSTQTLSFQPGGGWTQQTGDNFFNQTSTYTGAQGANVETNFTGSAVWVYGDQVNDHGSYTVYLNNTAVGTYTQRSGCANGYAKSCEKLHGLAFFAGPLPQGQHQLKIVNAGTNGQGQQTFFDFDYLEYTTPSVWPQLAVAGASTSAGGSASGTNTGSATSSAPATTSSHKSAAADGGFGTALLAVVAAAWVVRKVVS
ncbi:uncharacterized protein LOC62_04G006608 [Vanrija pseudolonga]|uniref:Uncharacterized protein n=1 Tax=Vanrija pseudolonga TaxID=143232 RepID=A0AAF1BJU3_9TREE|nr:hypothetical protein LOC62_04G006608 [Vanrija pseudolonga]